MRIVQKNLSHPPVASWYALNAKLVTQHPSWDNAMMYGEKGRGRRWCAKVGELLPDPTLELNPATVWPLRRICPRYFASTIPPIVFPALALFLSSCPWLAI